MKREMIFPELTSPNEFYSFYQHVANKYFKWHEFTRADDSFYFCAIRAKGPFKEAFDYGTGLMRVSIHTFAEYNTINGKLECNYQTIFYIGNIDDGCWRACSKYFDTMEKANNHTRKVYEAYKEGMEISNTLPTEEELNRFLLIYGMWGEYEG